MYRKHLRLPEFDYSASYYYFVTVCTDYRKKVFVPRVSVKYTEDYSRKDVVAISNRLEETLQEKRYTDIVEKILVDLPEFYTNLAVDFYVLMQDHIHFILGFEGDVTFRNMLSQPITNRHYTNSRKYTLGDIVKTIKKVSMKQLRLAGYIGPVWQPNYYEHVIRDNRSLNKIRRYILNNPMVESQEIPWKTIDSV